MLHKWFMVLYHCCILEIMSVEKLDVDLGLKKKSHLMHIKQVTIPRFELMAATLSVKSNLMITRELDIDISRSLSGLTEQ